MLLANTLVKAKVNDIEVFKIDFNEKTVDSCVKKLLLANNKIMFQVGNKLKFLKLMVL